MTLEFRKDDYHGGQGKWLPGNGGGNPDRGLVASVKNSDDLWMARPAWFWAPEGVAGPLSINEF